MRRYAHIWFAGLALACLSGLEAANAEAPLQVTAVAQDAPSLFNAQLLGDMDRPVGDGIKLKGLKIPARLDAKGVLELDVKGEGKFKAIPKQDVISVTLKGDGEKPKDLNIKLLVFKRDDGVWCYRNMTMLLVAIGSEQFVVIDANGNGVYNEPGADGMAWAGQTWLFPLPDKAERWCSATQEFTGLQFGAWGENPAAQGKPLATTIPETLPMLKGVNDERVALGLTPRPEDVKLSAELQKHCSYMSQNNTLAHGEDQGKSGYSAEGNAAGLRSILSAGTGAAQVAARMVQTYFHRQDVIRPGALAFGVGYAGRYGGIDGRTNCGKAPAHFWPVICPVPGQTGLPLSYAKEMPDATPGDDAAGY
ncbi:MAG: hypothetical protein NTW87_17750, partial [Planctomycetota bacterium]|nr:hypothetical protein [Planctomycetota bacterium]